MAATVEIRIPDIGDFKDVEVVEIHVKTGDAIACEQALITVESDKATLDIPSPMAGTIASIALRIGDKVSQGTVIGEAVAAAPRHGAAEDIARSAVEVRDEGAPRNPGRPGFEARSARTSTSEES